MIGWLMSLAALQAAVTAPPLGDPFDLARSAPLTPGDWIYEPLPTGSVARFGARFEIRCDRTTRRVLVRAIALVATAPLAARQIATDTAVRIIPADGWLRADDPLLAAIAFSRGRFIVSGGGERLILPASPEAARSVQDCRN